MLRLLYIDVGHFKVYFLNDLNFYENYLEVRSFP